MSTDLLKGPRERKPEKLLPYEWHLLGSHWPQGWMKKQQVTLCEPAGMYFGTGGCKAQMQTVRSLTSDLQACKSQ